MPYEEIARRGGGIASSARALAEATDEEVLAQARAIRAEMLAHGTTTFEAKTGYGLSREGELRAVRLARQLGADAVTGLFAHAVPPGLRRRRLDGRGRPRWPPRRTSTRSTSTSSRSRSATRTSSGWARSRGARACRCARTSSSSTPTARCRSRSPPARARSTTSPACTRTTSRRWPPPSAPPCSCPAPSSWAPRRPRPAARWPTRARSACWPPTATPAPRPVASLPARHRARRAALRLDGARGAGRVHAQRGVGARPGRPRLDRGRQARRPASCSTRRSSTSRYRFGRNPVARGDRRRASSVGVITAERPRASCSPTSSRSGFDEDGGTTRLAWTREDEEAAGWFARRAAAIGPRMERDPAGNLWACPTRPARGGRPARTWTACAAAGASTARSASPPRSRWPSDVPLAVISFADEEGARFNTPTFGSPRAGRAARRRRRARPRRRARRARSATRWPTPASTRPGSPTRRSGSSGCAASSSCTSTRRATSPPRARPRAWSRGWPRGCGCRSSSPAGPTTPGRRRARSATTRSPPPRG